MNISDRMSTKERDRWLAVCNAALAAGQIDQATWDAYTDKLFDVTTTRSWAVGHLSEFRGSSAANREAMRASKAIDRQMERAFAQGRITAEERFAVAPLAQPSTSTSTWKRLA